MNFEISSLVFFALITAIFMRYGNRLKIYFPLAFVCVVLYLTIISLFVEKTVDINVIITAAGLFLYSLSLATLFIIISRSVSLALLQGEDFNNYAAILETEIKTRIQDIEKYHLGSVSGDAFRLNLVGKTIARLIKKLHALFGMEST